MEAARTIMRQRKQKLISLLLQETGAQSILVITNDADWKVSENVTTASLEEVSDQQAEMVLWLDAHQFPLDACQEMMNRLAHMTDIIAFAAEPPAVTEVYPTLLWPDQWATHFVIHDYILVDRFRTEWCRLDLVEEDIAQNLVIFARKNAIAERPTWKNYILPTAKRQIHPARICRHEETGALIPGTEEKWTISDFLWEKWRDAAPSRPFISVVITFHREQYLAHRSLNGLTLLCEQAQAQGLMLEIICIMDNADDVTMEVVSNHSLIRKLGRIVESSHGDPGCGRNEAVDLAKGDYIAIMDGDDLYSQNWLVAAYKRCREFSLPVIVHTDYMLAFDQHWYYLKTPDVFSCSLKDFVVPLENFWFSACFGHRQIFQMIPYVRADVNMSGFGYEDWHWNCETFAAGIPHIVAPETVLYYRRKSASRVTQDISKQAIIGPTAYLHSERLHDLHAVD